MAAGTSAGICKRVLPAAIRSTEKLGGLFLVSSLKTRIT
jgi:hypothetical protein